MYFKSGTGNTKDIEGNNYQEESIFQVSSDEERIWDCRQMIGDSENSDNSSDSTSWVPLEGIFGIYIVPSGTIWVLVTGSETVYNAPPILNHHDDSRNNRKGENINGTDGKGRKQHNPQLESWLQIRKVTDLELVHIPNRIIPASQLKEEVRQVQLLRKGLKQHSFYYVSSQNDECDSQVVPDMTKNIQRSFQTYLDGTRSNPLGNHNLTETSTEAFDDNSDSLSKTTNEDGSMDINVVDEVVQDAMSEICSETKVWWEDPMDKQNPDRPDSRFFWNEAAIEPLIQRYHDDKDETSDLEENEKDDSTMVSASAGNRLLLEHMLPLTSAFVGVQRNVTVSPAEGETTKKPSLVYDELLISRRSRFRAGTRFTKRGADATGAVANYAETEQVCLILQNVIKHKNKKSKTKKELPTQSLYQLCSHIQTRGSIPLRWSSPTDIKTYRPRVRIGMDPIAQARALVSHIIEQLALYTFPDKGNQREIQNMTSAKIIFVNLIDKHSDQGRLGRAFDAVLEAVMEVYAPPNTTIISTTNTTNTPATLDVGETSGTEQSIILEPNAVEHIWYDFHAEVKKGRWYRLAKLLKRLQPSLMDHGYFCARAPTENSSEWVVDSQQRAVVRTNCMDCLDRTNVVQSLFGRWVLFHQLEKLTSQDSSNTTKRSELPRRLSPAFVSAYKKNSMALPWDNGEVAHRLLWADNADAISRLYAGTPALKGDFTRTGKRTKRGALDDGMNSLQRYYLNNFLDADRQEGTDLLVGYQLFSNLDGYNNEDDAPDVSGGNNDPSTMTLQEAARQMMLGNNVLKTEDDDEKNYARIKEYKHHHPYLRKSLDQVVGGASLSTRKRGYPLPDLPLDLRWLPGDVQDNMRSRAMAIAAEQQGTDNRGFNMLEALASLDRRAASKDPWWYLPNSDDEDDNIDGDGDDSATALVDRQVESRLNPLTASIHSGYTMSIGLLCLWAPKTMAAIVVALLGAFYFPFPFSSIDDDDDDGESDDNNSDSYDDSDDNNSDSYDDSDGNGED